MSNVFLAAGNEVLRNGENGGGITFENISDSDITITGLTFSPFLQAISTSTAIIVRIYDPSKEVGIYSVAGALAEQKIEGATSKIIIDNFSYLIPANGKRNLLVRVLGVRKVNMGLDPKIVLTISNINTNPPDVGTDVELILQWTCLLVNAANPSGWFSVTPVDTSKTCQ